MAKKERHQVAEINVVPYIDVMLVLLVIFMITTPIITQGVNVDLPETTAQPVETKDEPPIVIQVTIDGLYSVRESGEDRVFSNVAEVTQIVGVYRGKHPEAPVVIGGDKQADYGNVVVLIAALQQIGVHNVGLLTQDNAPTKKSRP